jgi:hypothetical protein
MLIEEEDMHAEGMHERKEEGDTWKKKWTPWKASMKILSKTK